MKRIAFISTMSGYTPEVPRWAGCEELWGAAALRLAARGELTVGVNVFRWPEEVPQIEQLKRAGCLVKMRKTIPGLARLGPAIPALLQTAWLRRFRPHLTVITQHQFHTEPEWAERCRKTSLPYVTVVHGVDETLQLSESDRLRLRANYEWARRCYFVAERNLAAVEEKLGARLENAAIVRNPFKVPHDDPPPYPSTDAGFALGFVARLDHLKGHDLLLDVLAQEKWRTRELRVSCFGAGALAERLAETARARGLHQVTFCGVTNDVRAIWASHHALVLPSRTEGLPLTVVEAMLCDRPCIVTNVGGIPELVTDGETGFIAASPSLAELDAALERAWARRAEWQQIGQAAGAHARALIPRDPGETFAQELLTLLAA